MVARGGTIIFNRRTFVAGISGLAIEGIPATALAEDALKSGQFRDEMVAWLRRARPNWQVKLLADPAGLEIDHLEVYLDNIYRRVAGVSGPAREARIQSFFDAMESAAHSSGKTETFAEVGSRLRARLVSAASVALAGSDKFALLARPFSPQTRIAYVVDAPLTMSYVALHDVERWAVAPEVIHTTAIENLEAISRDVPIEPRTPESQTGVFTVIQSRDGYVAARLLAPKFMARIGEELGPEFFVAAPMRDLLIAWSVDCAVKSTLAAMSRNYVAKSAYPVSDELFVWSGDHARLANPIELIEHGRP
jgi:uncharacterized protein YtpQ (UPF0354 family)